MLDSMIVEIAIPILGGIWSLIQGSKWWERRKNRKLKRAIKFIRAAVGYVWKTYYREEKKASRAMGGTIAPTTKEHAMKLAVSHAIALAKKSGFDLYSIFPSGTLQEEIEDVINSRKGRKSW